ncbi:MAG: hypothetical protein MJZ17_00825 [Bacteroidales bacterium]|nr:hypothetical protein [Bacteroidales bacterium]
MKELEEYLNWCDQMYSSSSPCQCGNACTNANYCQGQQQDCYSCIQRVHHYWNTTIHYNCEKMVYCYTLKHGYRFGAEIFYEFQREQASLSQFEDIFIASIGCGPCTELFGSLLQWRSMGKPDSMYHFRGFDTERVWWDSLMQQVVTFFPNADVETYCEDVFAHYADCQERVDVIVLNYMLSDMKKFNPVAFNVFLDNLVTFIEQKHVRYIMVNDIYLKISVGASRDLLNALNHSGINCGILAWQYSGLNNFIGQYGQIIPRQKFRMNNASIVNRYAPFSEVNSIQTIIRVQ